MTYHDNWTGDFVADKLRRHDGVDSVERLGPNALRLKRKHGHSTVEVLTVDFVELDATDLDELIVDFPDASGIVNVRRDAKYTGAAKERAQQRGVGLFTMKELMGAAGSGDFAGYERRSMEYAKRVVPQHSHVLAVEHVDQDRLLVVRNDLPNIKFVTADIYIVGVADVRSLLTTYPDIDAIVKTNPNGEYSDAAKEAARSAGVGLFTFKEFMGALNFSGQRFLDYGA